MNEQQLCCPSCKTPAPGRIVVIDGLVWLDLGVMLVERGRRHCHACGKPFYWSRPKSQQPVSAANGRPAVNQAHI